MPDFLHSTFFLDNWRSKWRRSSHRNVLHDWSPASSDNFRSCGDSALPLRSQHSGQWIQHSLFIRSRSFLKLVKLVKFCGRMNMNEVTIARDFGCFGLLVWWYLWTIHTSNYESIHCGFWEDHADRSICVTKLCMHACMMHTLYANILWNNLQYFLAYRSTLVFFCPLKLHILSACGVQIDPHSRKGVSFRIYNFLCQL